MGDTGDRRLRSQQQLFAVIFFFFFSFVKLSVSSHAQSCTDHVFQRRAPGADRFVTYTCFTFWCFALSRLKSTNTDYPAENFKIFNWRAPGAAAKILDASARYCQGAVSTVRLQVWCHFGRRWIAVVGGGMGSNTQHFHLAGRGTCRSI